jgi:hypothetical protein
MELTSHPDLERIRQLAARLAETDAGPAGELASALAAAVSGLSDRVDALWQLISAVVESAGLSSPAASPADPASPAPPEFVQALNSARATGRRGVRLSVDGKEWVAALSQHPPVAEHEAWSAIERLARRSDQDDRADT